MDAPKVGSGPIPEKYLDLRPQDTYEENIDAIDALIDGEYDTVGETYADFHPRVFHSAFRESYRQEAGAAKVDEEAMKQLQWILEENSGNDYFWPEEKLFNYGYRRGPKNRRKSRSRRRRERKSPDLPHGRDMIPESGPGPLDNPVRRGRKKREADEYYFAAGMRMAPEIADYDIEILDKRGK
ncbi:hypothetical protein [Candidatus Nanohalovita haloferacivicina]|uniref:hypothetical protein n=1 Tax=Candidatus Nanohalovita haloferacivicina TaxID=2978046 RepID=UPI00325FD046|nr:hypothetical protein HBNXNv_1045 [Candidatus Nanohalobia archaeon BNXNv]